MKRPGAIVFPDRVRLRSNPSVRSAIAWKTTIIQLTPSSLRTRYLSRRLCRACVYTPRSHRKYNVPSRLTFPTWATSTEAANATYAQQKLLARLSSLLTPNAFVASDQSAEQSPAAPLARLHPHLFVRVWVGARMGVSHHSPIPLCCWLGITQISRFRLRLARACGTRSMPSLRA